MTFGIQKNILTAMVLPNFMVKNFTAEEKGHGAVNLRTAIQRSCDVYFYEVARLLGVDRLSETAKKFGLGKKVLTDFVEERAGVVPSTSWKKIYWKKTGI